MPKKLPPDFAGALEKNAKAKAAWERIPPSHKKEHLEAIEDAKQAATRKRRIEKSIAMLAATEGKSGRLSKPSEKPLAAKLGVKAGHRLVAINVPDDYDALLGALPEGATRGTKDGDVVHLFAADTAELKKHFPKAARALKDGGLLWISYPKGAAGTDLNRDRGWDVVNNAGFQGVSLVAAGAKWAAMRFKRA